MFLSAPSVPDSAGVSRQKLPFQRLSSIPGRIRWRVSDLAFVPDLGDRLTAALGAEKGIVSITINPRTQRVLVLFDESVTLDRLEAILLQAFPPRGDAARTDASPAQGNFPIRAHEAALGSLAAFGAGGAYLARIVALGLTVDGLFVTAPAGQAAVAFGAMIAATLAGIQLKRLNGRFWQQLGRRVEFETRLSLVERLLRSEIASHDKRSIKELTAAAQNNLAQLERGFDGLGELVAIATNTILLTGAFALLAPQLVWIPLLALGVMTFVIRKGYLEASSRYDEAAEARVAIDRRMVEAIDALPTVKAFNLEALLLDRLAEDSAFYRERSLVASDRGSRYPLKLEAITLFGVAFTTVAAALIFSAGTLSPGVFLILMMISGHLFYPYSHMTQPLESVVRGWAAYREVRRMGTLPIESDPGDGAVALDRSRVPGIDFKGVSFGYTAGGLPTLEGIDLHFRRGAMVGIVGGSGSGKSTLTKLLIRLYDPSAGSVHIDGVDLRQFRRRDLRDLISFIDQRSFLFEGSIGHNILFGRPDADQDDIEEAARIAGIDDFVRSLPEGYATEVGVRGSKLSDGQRQRVLLARGLLKRSQVLVLDEATSSLDAETERVVLNGIRERMQGRTTVVISHRLSNVIDADMIVVMNKGRVIGVGDHAALLAENDHYRSLLHEQE